MSALVPGPLPRYVVCDRCGGYVRVPSLAEAPRRSSASCRSCGARVRAMPT